ncbi:hypothetical protein [Aliterella atlantica]|uniref:Glucose-inhibited division protein A n=1 Tax=Aliterella atlantica CENA595 TaxID=1618023 RepID=A0A0D8ZUT7_9CYAN|nr:hypothetical protein [Aliterella atlantica]KJH71006.1 glucose-inhibited division protein A [Aliterella atlantica CENA595]
MERSKIVAVVTGAIALFLGIAYLVIVQFLDFRGEMLPAPQSQLVQPSVTIAQSWDNSDL